MLRANLMPMKKITRKLFRVIFFIHLRRYLKLNKHEENYFNSSCSIRFRIC